MIDPAPERGVALRVVRRWRSPLVLIPLVAGLMVSGVIGARMLWADIPPKPAPSPSVVCWNGVEQPRIDCGLPTGASGLHWVFPTFRPYSGRCEKEIRAERELERPTEYTCRVPFRKTTVTLLYSQRTTLERGLKFIASVYEGIDADQSRSGERLVYRDPSARRDGTYQLTVSYERVPYAVTINAATIELRDQALEELVSFRPPEFISVRPEKKAR